MIEQKFVIHIHTIIMRVQETITQQIKMASIFIPGMQTEIILQSLIVIEIPHLKEVKKLMNLQYIPKKMNIIQI
jgi:hypothetical protein